MRRSSVPLWILLALLPFALAACGGGGGDAPAAIEGYLEALVAKDADGVINLCKLDQKI